MTPDEAYEVALAEKRLGKSVREAFARFEGTGVSWIAMTKAVCDAYQLDLRTVRDIFDAHYSSLDVFKRPVQ